MLKNRYFNTVALSALLAMGFGGGAVAQTAPSADAPQSEVVIVTATKRAERLVDVPISLSVVGGRDIQQTGIRELRETATYIPNVIISQNNDYGSTVTIRGVGANSRNIGFDSRVGVYVDGIYMGQSPSLNQELLDVVQVEVLRGPQGTLFGKDTVAGAHGKYST
ncbi:MAG: TonB-dependent receptor [Hyphomonadaceae bacterium]|nr:MAG: TonB-dependent receptor [Hyphomonadaceae bacterium]